MGARLFLGHQRHVGEGRAQARGDQGVRGLVRLGHGGCVGLGAHGDVGALVDFHDAGARRQRKAAHLRDESVELHPITPVLRAPQARARD